MAADASELRNLAKIAGRRSRDIPQRADRALRKSALDMVGDAKIVAPKDTGYMASTIDMASRGLLKVELGPTANYSFWVEHGTSRMAAQPFMHPSVDRRLPGLVKALSRTVTL